TLWTGSTVPQPSIFRDFEARERLRDFAFFDTTIWKPRRDAAATADRDAAPSQWAIEGPVS
ncbi:MAG: hypothetical protein QNL17_05770, partial [Synechococcus sp. ChSW.bin.154]